MKKSVKAALLSALVYPGVGHFFLKRYAISAVLFCGFSVPLYFVVSEIFAKTEKVMEQIRNGEIPLNIVAISESLAHLTTSVDSQQLNIKIYVLVVIWIIAIIHSFKLGRGDH
ncbi:MAG: hypothetical protein ACI94Z_001493 [Yoonia sp.]|jgi:hypothetical protein